MENKIYKKYNSLENFKKILLIILNFNLLGFLNFWTKKYSLINIIYNNFSFYIYNGLNYIKLKFLFFFTGFPLGTFILTKKHNRHVSFKKLKKKKR